jgi:anti-anti-sigma regulatory factor
VGPRRPTILARPASARHRHIAAPAPWVFLEPPVKVSRTATATGNTCLITITDDPVFHDFALSQLVLDTVFDSDQPVTIDCRFITAMHSPALANLVRIHLALMKRGQRLVLTGLSAHNRKLLATTRLDQLFSIEGESAAG